MSRLSTRLYRSLLIPNAHRHHLQLRFSTDHLSDAAADTDADVADTQGERVLVDRPLEDGLDIGIYKAILIGKAGQVPFQKKLKSGTVVTLLSLGTGGIRNNRRPLENENPKDYANRSVIQWHRVSIYPQGLGNLVAKNVLPGSMLYVEGNLETKVFTDPITGLARRIREVSVRRNGRVVFLGGGGDAEQQTEQNGLKAVGYY